MTTATTAPVPAPADPTLDALVPRPAVGRTLGTAVALLAVVVGAWLVAGGLRPAAVPSGTAGSWRPLGPDEVLSVTGLEATGWLDVDVRAVRDVPGARVTGAWLLPAAPGEPGVWEDMPDPVTSGSGRTVPAGDARTEVTLDAAHGLPQRLSPGDRGWLVMRWEVTSCDALEPYTAPLVEISTPLGVHRSEALPDYVSPAFATDDGVPPDDTTSDGTTPDGTTPDGAASDGAAAPDVPRLRCQPSA